MPLERKLPRWLTIGLALPLIFLNSWLLLLIFRLLQPISSIVVAACLISFLLDYPIVFLEKRGMKRGLAVGLILLLTLIVFAILALVLIPLILQQLIEFINRLPVLLTAAKQYLDTLDSQPLFQDLPIDLSELTTQFTNQVYAIVQSLPSQIFGLTLDTISIALNLLLVVVLTIFLVFTGERLWNGVFSWLPAPHNLQIQTSLKQSFQSYFAAQATIASILSSVLMIVFLVLRIPFGLLFGLVIGIASVIPFGGVLTVLTISLLLALQNFWLGIEILAVALIIGQINENIIVPRLVGSATGLNPAVVFISLLIGAKLGGVLGVILVIPTVSFVKRTADTLRADTNLLPLTDVATSAEAPKN